MSNTRKYQEVTVPRAQGMRAAAENKIRDIIDMLEIESGMMVYDIIHIKGNGRNKIELRVELPRKTFDELETGT